jgi:hypothetical protein
MIQIKNFEPKDLEKGIFLVELLANSPETFQELCKIEESRELQKTIFSDCDFNLQLGTKSMGFILDSFLWNSLSLKFEATYKKALPRGKPIKVRLMHGSKVLDEEMIFIPVLSSTPPSISQIFPIAGSRGSNVKIYGKNFGENLDKIKIVFYYYREKHKLEAGFTYPNDVTSPNAGGVQELQFTIPENLEIHSNQFFLTPIQTVIYANYQESYYESEKSLEFYLLNSNWKWSLFLGSFLILLLVYLIIAILLKNLLWIRALYIDPSVNKLSLARFEFISWSSIFLFALVYMCLFYIFFNQYYNLLRWENSLFALTLVVYIPIIASLIL